jgi:L-rhamnose mutarotase
VLHPPSRPDRLDEYVERHAAVWPEMLHALRDAGWHDYTLHLREDGLLIGVLSTDNFPAAQAAMEDTEVNRRWQQDMTPFFADLDSATPDRGMHVLPEIFNLEAQLERAEETGAPK